MIVRSLLKCLGYKKILENPGSRGFFSVITVFNDAREGWLSA